MFIILILPVLVSGFIVCRKNPYYYYKLHRYEGQHLYLMSAMLGAVCLAVAFFLLLLMNKCTMSLSGEQIGEVLGFNWLLESAKITDTGKIDRLVWLSLLSIMVLLVARVFAFCGLWYLRLINHDESEAKILLMNSILKDNPLGELLFHSYVNNKPIMLSLENRKVYVGIVTRLGEPNETIGIDEEIIIVPSASGCRDPETLKVKFNTDYMEAGTSCSLVIKQPLIQSASEFDYKTFNLLNPETQKN